MKFSVSGTPTTKYQFLLYLLNLFCLVCFGFAHQIESLRLSKCVHRQIWLMPNEKTDPDEQLTATHKLQNARKKNVLSSGSVVDFRRICFFFAFLAW